MKRIFSIIVSVFVISSLCCQAMAQSREDDVRRAKEQAEYRKKQAERLRAKQQAEAERQRAKQQAEASSSQGMLKAFGLKGKVKTVTFEGEITIAFDPQGNMVGSPNYNGGKTSVSSSEYFRTTTIGFNNWKWTEISWEPWRMGSTSQLEVTSYDAQNRPKTANFIVENKVLKRNVAITYSGSDSHGNYTKINFATKDAPHLANSIYTQPETFNVKYTYWPESATVADVARPMTDTEVVVLIQHANKMDQSLLTKKLWDILSLEGSVPYIYENEYENKYTFYVNGMPSALIQDLSIESDDQGIPNASIEIEEQRYSDDGEHATIVFYYKDLDHPSGNPQYNPFTDNEHLRRVDCVFEDGQWKVANIANKVERGPGPLYYYPEYWLIDDDVTYQDRQKQYRKSFNFDELEREVREKFARDPKLPQYLATVQAFKNKINGNSGASSSSNQIYTAVEEAPRFPGGDSAMYEFLSKNIRYPEMAAICNIQGRVTVQFVVEKNGSIGEVKVVRGKDPDLDKEAVRVVKSMPKFIPGKLNGEAVRVWYTLPINFHLQ